MREPMLLAQPKKETKTSEKAEHTRTTVMASAYSPSLRLALIVTIIAGWSLYLFARISGQPPEFPDWQLTFVVAFVSFFAVLLLAWLVSFLSGWSRESATNSYQRDDSFRNVLLVYSLLVLLASIIPFFHPFQISTQWPPALICFSIPVGTLLWSYVCAIPFVRSLREKMRRHRNTTLATATDLATLDIDDI